MPVVGNVHLEKKWLYKICIILDWTPLEGRGCISAFFPVPSTVLGSEGGHNKCLLNHMV